MLTPPAVQSKPLAEISRSVATWLGSFEPFRPSRTR